MSEETPSGEEQPSHQGEGLEEVGDGDTGANVGPGGITDPPPEDAPQDNASEAKVTTSGDPDPEADDESDDSEPMPVRALPDNEVLRELLEGFEDATWELSLGQDVVHIDRERFAELGEAARDIGFEVCADVTAVDWLRERPIRYQVVANLLSHQHRLRLRLITDVPRTEPSVPSLTPIWPGAGYPEREVYDMFGIDFRGHPDLTRILMPDEWEGHPLRKDFAVGSVPVQFKDSHKVR